MSILDTMRGEALAAIDRAANIVSVQTLKARQALAKVGVPFLAAAVRLAEETGAPGGDKKAAVMALAAEFYDRVIQPIDLPGPDQILDPLLKQLWLQIADVTVDGIVALFKSTEAESITASFRNAA